MQWGNGEKKGDGNELGDWGDELETGSAGRDLTAKTQWREEKCFVYFVPLWEKFTAENERTLSLHRET
jgi:hypothetical protein